MFVFVTRFFFYILIGALLCPDQLFSQIKFINHTTGAPDLTFNSLSPAPNNTYYVGGTFRNIVGFSGFIARATENGDFLWKKYFGTMGQNGIRAITTASDQSVIVGGYAANGQAWDFAVAKFDTGGNMLWSRKLFPRWINECYAVAPTDDGGVIASGYTKYDTNPSLMIVRLREDGGLVWSKVYTSSAYDVIYSIAGTDDGNFVLAGTHSIGMNVQPLVMKIDSSGNVIWGRSFYTPVYGTLTSVTALPGGRVAVAGNFELNNNNKIGLYIIAPNGTLLLYKVFGGFADDNAYSIRKAWNGDILIAGNTNSFGAGGEYDQIVMRISSEGTDIWGKAYSLPGLDILTAIQPTNDGGFLASGNNGTGSSSKGILLKASSEGDAGCLTNSINLISLQMTSQATPSSIQFLVVNDEGISPTPWELSNSAFVPAYYCFMIPVELKSYNISNTGNRFDINWETASEKNNFGFEVYCEDEKIAFVPGKGTSTEVNKYSVSHKVTKNGAFTIKLYQIDLDGSRTELFSAESEISNELSFNLSQNYPNPFNPATTIEYILPEAGYFNLELFDVTGKLVRIIESGEKSEGYHTVNLDMSHLNSGLYLYRATFEGVSVSRKLMLLK